MLALGLDIGSTNLKVALVEIDADPEPRVRAVESRPTPRDGAALLSTAGRLLESMTAWSETPPRCVGIASMAESGVPLDADDRPLGEVVRWDPQRAQQQAERLSARLGREELVRATGVRPSGKVPLATWAHLREHEPDRWATMHRWAGVADLVALGLTGRLVTDHTLAGRTMAYRLPAPGAGLPPSFDADLLAEVGLTPDKLAEVAPPGQVAGGVRPGAPLASGLPVGTPVIVSGHDHPVGAWAGGVREPGQVADSVGTAEALVRVLRAPVDPVSAADAGMSLVRTVDGEHEALLAGASSAGAMVAWWAEHMADGHDLAELFDRAAKRGAPSASLLVLPYLSGRQTPRPDPSAHLRILGEPADHDVVGGARALLDGLSLHARWMHEEQARLAAEDPADGHVHVLGSAAGPGTPWLATKAAVGPARLRAVHVGEPVAAGAALLAAHRAGLAQAPMLPGGPVAQGPDPTYEPLYDLFVRAASQGGP
ncbi:hypothetical protein GCM10023169_21220 [Georgenia halophila]|uniref:Xylulokinase n=1 Tax=Georgenia halophila TaxID=620889 RepID=A0ABP8L926_9MICO